MQHGEERSTLWMRNSSERKKNRKETALYLVHSRSFSLSLCLSLVLLQLIVLYMYGMCNSCTPVQSNFSRPGNSVVYTTIVYTVQLDMYSKYNTVMFNAIAKLFNNFVVVGVRCDCTIKPYMRCIRAYHRCQITRPSPSHGEYCCFWSIFRFNRRLCEEC